MFDVTTSIDTAAAAAGATNTLRGQQDIVSAVTAQIKADLNTACEAIVEAAHDAGFRRRDARDILTRQGLMTEAAAPQDATSDATSDASVASRVDALERQVRNLTTAAQRAGVRVDS